MASSDNITNIDGYFVKIENSINNIQADISKLDKKIDNTNTEIRIINHDINHLQTSVYRGFAIFTLATTIAIFFAGNKSERKENKHALNVEVVQDMIDRKSVV